MVLDLDLYLLIWISSKYAKTIKQKMDMSGINLNVDNVEKFVKESKNKILTVKMSQKWVQNFTEFYFSI